MLIFTSLFDSSRELDKRNKSDSFMRKVYRNRSLNVLELFKGIKIQIR